MNLFRKSDWPTVSHDELVKRARLLVIDDGEFPYLKLFERDGYTIEKWPDVSDLSALETGRFDILLLDLHGVGQDISADQGLGVLAHIREVNPAQIVVAYSNAEWSVEYQQFFDSADAVLHKTKDDYVEFKRTVDRLLDERFSLGFFLNRITEALDGSNAPADTVSQAKRAILKNRPDRFKKYLESNIDDPVTADRVLTIVNIGITTVSLWKN